MELGASSLELRAWSLAAGAGVMELGNGGSCVRSKGTKDMDHKGNQSFGGTNLLNKYVYIYT